MRLACLALPVMLLLTACGFEPLYGDASQRQMQALQATQINTENTREGQILRAVLEDAFNPSAVRVTPQYQLQARLQFNSTPVLIDPDGTVARFMITLSSPFTLTRIADKKLIYQGTVTRRTSFNVSEDDDYATFINRKDVRQRVTDELAEDYRLRLLAYFNRLH